MNITYDRDYMTIINKLLIDTEINGLKILDYSKSNKKHYFKCLCVCGKEFSARTDSIKIGTTRSCGCLKGDLISNKNKLSNNLGAINLLYRSYKHNAEKRNLIFDLSLDQFKELINNGCNYCGSPPILQKILKNQTKYKRRDIELIYNGIDRVDNNIGYILHNCVTCCSICNGAKSNLSLEVFENWIKRLVLFNEK